LQRERRSKRHGLCSRTLRTLSRCTHGDVIEGLLGRSVKKGAAVVLDGLHEVEEIPAPS
jgi:hypothetical protein